ncbi:MAG: AAA family ATPase [Ferruginibacter sp.]
MRINNIKIANILSFGDNTEQHVGELKDLSAFNLFIGKNGTGKSNVLNLLGNLKISFKKCHQTSLSDYPNQLHETYLDKSYKNKNSLITKQLAFLKIEYKKASIKEYIQSSDPIKKIIFKESEYESNPIIYLEKGDISDLCDSVIVVKENISNDVFLNDVIKLGHSDKNFTKLNEGLCYIFDRTIGVLKTGAFLEVNNHEPQDTNEPEFDYSKLPSGFLNCAKILTQILLNSKPQHPLLILDEPELHLEPRTCRKLINFLFYLRFRGENERDKEKVFYHIKEKVNGKRKDFSERYQKEIFPSPGLQHDYWFEQIFIASHSSVILSEFLNKSKWSSIYEFYIKPKEVEKTHESLSHNVKGLFSTIKKINPLAAHSILDNLGNTGTDLLQTNGVIWVEGPSDMAYIRKWLELYAEEKVCNKFEQGIHYEFKPFAGTLLGCYCIDKENKKTEEEKAREDEKLISMFSFSRNAFIIIDSDAFEDNGEIIDVSTFKKAKKIIKRQFKEKNKQGYNLGLWYNEGDTFINTIEKYLPHTPPKTGSKLSYAKRITKEWTKYSHPLSSFKGNLEKEIQNLYRCIEKWNE